MAANPPSAIPLGVAVIGLGVGEQHAHAFAADPGCALRWLVDTDREKAEQVAGRVGSGAVATSLDEVLGDKDVHIVSIATFDHLHADQVVACLNAGKHVFVEKPLCRTEPELAAIITAWKAAERPHLRSNLVLREAEMYRWLAEEIQAGAFGRIYAIDGDYLYGRLDKITEGWRGEVPDYSVIEGGGIHMIDLMVMLSGERPDTVSCIGNRIGTEDTAFRYDDFMAASYTFPSGLIGRITANFACVHRHHHVLRVFGTEATFIYDDAGPRLHLTRDEDQRAAPIDMNPLASSKGALIPGFVQAIRDGQGPGTAAIREFDLIRIIAATDRAHQTQTPQDIEYTP
ncbi:MAG: Gfo/Idh/MocA family oxidoreductase [Rhodospirillales bacterium]